MELLRCENQMCGEELEEGRSGLCDDCLEQIVASTPITLTLAELRNLGEGQAWDYDLIASKLFAQLGWHGGDAIPYMAQAVEDLFGQPEQ